jgi:oligopeptide transport system permease protein
MLRFAFRRLLTTIPTLLAIITISFFLMHLAPGGPFDNEKAIPIEIKAQIERVYHLDQPIWQQFLGYLYNLAHGDLGPSYIIRNFTVRELFATSLPVSIFIGSWAMVFALSAGILLGCIAALRQNKWLDYLVIAFATAGSTLPTYVIGPLYQFFFGLVLRLSPVGGWDNGSFSHTIGPIITLGLPQLAIVARLMRGAMIESLNANHIRTARALGLSDYAVVVKHALRGALLPIVSYAGPAAAQLVTGSLIVEEIFQIPGVGRYFIYSALNRDYTLVMGTVVLIATFTLIFNFVVDLLYAWIDPRVRYD